MFRDLQRPEYVWWKQFLIAAESWGNADLTRYQLNKFYQILHKALETPGYSKLYKNFVEKGKVYDSLENLLKDIPFTDKKLLQENIEAYTRYTPGQQYVTTGGSTGEPLGLYRTQTIFDKELASKAYLYSKIGWVEGDKQLVLRGIPIQTESKMELVEDLCELRCSTYNISNKDLEGYYKEATNYQPKWIKGYPSAVTLFCEWLVAESKQLPSVLGILCASETLYDWQKDIIEKAFPGKKLYSHYGHYELAALAGFCKHTSNYHVLQPYGYVELVDENDLPVTEVGQVGEIVATSLIMEVTPIIRYRTGDLAVFGGYSCKECGGKTLILSSVMGRKQEYLFANDDTKVSLTALNAHDDTFNEVHQIQYVQHEKGKVELLVKPKSTFDSVAKSKILGYFAMKAPTIAFTINLVENFTPTHRGKRKLLVSTIKE